MLSESVLGCCLRETAWHASEDAQVLHKREFVQAAAAGQSLWDSCAKAVTQAIGTVKEAKEQANQPQQMMLSVSFLAFLLRASVGWTNHQMLSIESDGLTCVFNEVTAGPIRRTLELRSQLLSDGCCV